MAEPPADEPAVGKEVRRTVPLKSPRSGTSAAGKRASTGVSQTIAEQRTTAGLKDV